ncbi:hypothetical protein C8D87_11753 [Lentzea atacamensis]|uniref:Uncharacterized protein n=1 Tax=Lentzea atacamensis TaxID=531938 RepID=A0ABX9DV27_9PSEU|nr:hypothetical protein [Lentzea atacamensis]RAS58883.1 hypothetical protein C8D87_11753 [Lentzea atacamensis]
MQSQSIRQDKVINLIRAIREEHHADFLSGSGHRDHLEAAEAAARKRHTIERNCTTGEIQAAHTEALKLGYLP